MKLKKESKRKGQDPYKLENLLFRKPQAIGGPTSNTALHKGQWNRGTRSFGRPENHLRITAYMGWKRHI